MDWFFTASAAIGALIISWLSRGRIRELEGDVWELRTQLKEIRAEFSAPQPDDQPVPEPEPYEAYKPYKPYAGPHFAPEAEDSDAQPPEPDFVSEPYGDGFIDRAYPERPRRAEEPRSFEQQFGARLPVWIGGIALALAGFFLVKYSIDIGLLTQGVRVTLGGVFGLGLLYAGHRLFEKPAIADNKRIAQSVIGAGIADLYACLFAATSLYHLLPSYAGFACMALVTLYAVLASLRYGAPIALLGLAGGFLTPVFIHSAEPSAPLLFLYLYFVLAGVMAVAHAKEWWGCSALAVSAAFAWVMVWLIASPLGGDGISIALFLMAVAATVVAATRSAIESVDEWDDPVALLNYLTLGGAALLMALTVGRADYDTASWILFFCLSAGGLILAWFKPRIYDFVPFLTLALNLCLLLAWRAPEPSSMALTILAFAALNVLGSRYFLGRSERPVLWAAFGGASLLAYYLTAYYMLHDSYNRVTIGFPFWGMMALLLAAYAIELAAALKAKFQGNEPTLQKLLAIFAATATAFLSLGLSIELPRDFLPVAFAGEVLAVSLIQRRIAIDALRWITLVLAVIFGALLIPQLVLLVELTAYSLFEVQLPLQSSVPIVTWPFFQLGLPAILFAASSYVLRRNQDDALVKGLEVATVALLGMMGYYVTRHLFHIDENVLFSHASFSERGVITNLLFGFGIACLAGGNRYGRKAVAISGLGLCGVALFRLCYFDLFLMNPLWSHQFVGDVPVFNALALTYGLPILFLYLGARQLREAEAEVFMPYIKFAMLALGFVWTSLCVTQIYHGGYLDSAASGNGEIYSYSVAWLLLGIFMLVAGTARRDKMLRTTSLAVMLLTVGKVFLYDASALDGLYRIFSFLGLGLSLLALSWFYTRFVFNERQVEREI